MNRQVLEELPRPVSLSSLDQLRPYTKIVADTGDFEKLRSYAPQDATTNPSLIFKAAQLPQYKHLLEKAIRDCSACGEGQTARVGQIMDNLLVLFGTEILKIVPGRVSTETDASLSFDTPGLIAKAERFISLYEANGIGRERILIKISSTWEGAQAAKVLESRGIHCNMTLLFSMAQAVACADAKATLISPFVGRILDWYKAAHSRDYSPAEDPGVQSVKTIYAYYKKHGIPTEIMGASFRNSGEILELAGCDLLTISPQLLEELSRSQTPAQRKLSPSMPVQGDIQRIVLDEKKFRWMLNEDAMATEKLAEGIRLFHADAVKLEKLIEQQLN